MILRVCVVIPTYNNLRTISEVVRDVIQMTPFPVLIVDDGSTTPVENSLYSWSVREAIEQKRIRVVRFDKNVGKGAALQFAIQDLVGRGFTHMITMDGDGQHLASELYKLVEKSLENPWDLVIGHRRIDSDKVPRLSILGRKFSNFWVNYQTGLQVQDSQSGFRMYPLYNIQNLTFFTRRFDFEIEVLIRTLWSGVEVREVEIEVCEAEAPEGFSHFHKVWDNFRIVALNFALVAVSLIKSHRDPGQFARAVGLGVFIGCSPLFGFHTLLVLLFGFFLRMNVVAMLIGSLVSMPMFAPMLVITSIYIGRNYLGVQPNPAAFSHFDQWLAGSVVVGGSLAIAAFALTYVTTKILQMVGRKRRLNADFKMPAKILNHPFLVTPYLYLFSHKARKGLNEYYRLLDSTRGFWHRQKQILRHFFKFGEILHDQGRQVQNSQFKLRPYGSEHLVKALKEHPNLILMSAHVGCWDLSAKLLGQPVLASMKEQRRDLVMADRPTGSNFELIPFLGKLAAFDVSVFKWAAERQTPLGYTFGFKAEGRAYDFYMCPLKHLSFTRHESKESQLYGWAEDFVEVLEQYVRQYPDQWFNFYPFWSSVPLGVDGRRDSTHVLIEDLESVRAPSEIKIPRPKLNPESSLQL